MGKVILGFLWIVIIGLSLYTVYLYLKKKFNFEALEKQFTGTKNWFSEDSFEDDDTKAEER